MNKHRDISFLCLFATQNQQGNPLLNILSLVVRAEKKIIHVRLDALGKNEIFNIGKYGIFHLRIFRIFQVTKKSNYSILEYSARTHPIMRFAVESYPKADSVVWCCTHKYTVESKKIQHCKTAPSSMFCCLFSVAHGFACCRYCSKKAFCSCIHVVVVVIINLLKIFC